METTELLLRHASYGLELVDALTGTELVGSSSVTVVGSDASPFLVNRSRWVFEDLAPGVATFSVKADEYVPLQVTTGSTELPNVPASTQVGILARLSLLPRTGYRFPPSLTRIVGSVRLASGVDPAEPLVSDATIVVTARHDNGSSIVSGVVRQTLSTDDGQFTMWFFPTPPPTQLDPPFPNKYSVTASKVIGGIPRTDSVTDVPLVAQAVNAVPILHLS